VAIAALMMTMHMFITRRHNTIYKVSDVPFCALIRYIFKKIPSNALEGITVCL
jgi:hypothetical protein